MWRIGSQIPPSRMMIPCVTGAGTVVTTVPALGRGDAVAAETEPAITTAAVGSASKVSLRRRAMNTRASFRVAWRVADDPPRRATRRLWGKPLDSRDRTRPVAGAGVVFAHLGQVMAT